MEDRHLLLLKVDEFLEVAVECLDITKVLLEIDNPLLGIGFFERFLLGKELEIFGILFRFLFDQIVVQSPALGIGILHLSCIAKSIVITEQL